MTVKVKCYFGKREKKIDKFRRHFLTYSLELSFHFIFHSYTILNKEVFSTIYCRATKVRTDLTWFVAEYLCCVIPAIFYMTRQDNTITWKAIKAISLF